MSILAGQWRQPTNTSANEKGGIHDDDTAQDLGFAGGTVAGSLHMEQFPPLLLQHFGDAWWQRGGLSLYFLHATMDKEPVRCFLDPTNLGTDEVQSVKVWMENEAGDIVMQGTASLGADANSEIQQRLKKLRPASDLRMLADVSVGEPSPVLEVAATDAMIDDRLAVITEPLPQYNATPRVVPMAPYVHLFRDVEPHIAPVRGPYVGLFGAIELQYLQGPVVAGKTYAVQGHAIGVSESPKTEVLWYQATLSDPDSGEPVARMIKMDRLMKGASPLWTDQA